MVNYNSVTYEGGDTLTVFLNSYETVQIQDAYTADLTGTRVTSTKPVAVFSGNLKTIVTGDGTVEDNLVEQIPPTRTWGTAYAVVPIPNAQGGTSIEIISRDPDTIVYFDGVQETNFLSSG